MALRYYVDDEFLDTRQPLSAVQGRRQKNQDQNCNFYRVMTEIAKLHGRDPPPKVQEFVDRWRIYSPEEYNDFRTRQESSYSDPIIFGLALASIHL